MFTTAELKNYIEKEIGKRLFVEGQRMLQQMVFFTEGKPNSISGTYVYAKNNHYCYFITERGQVLEKRKMDNERDVLYKLADPIIVNIAAQYAAGNIVAGRTQYQVFQNRQKELSERFLDIFTQEEMDKW